MTRKRTAATKQAKGSFNWDLGDGADAVELKDVPKAQQAEVKAALAAKRKARAALKSGVKA
jgi:hypothetical protein